MKIKTNRCHQIFTGDIKFETSFVALCLPRDIYHAKYYGKGGGLSAGEKNEKGERKKEENYIKKGEKGLKSASFWVINSKKFPRGFSDPPCRRAGVVPAAYLLAGGKFESQKRGGG